MKITDHRLCGLCDSARNKNFWCKQPIPVTTKAPTTTKALITTEELTTITKTPATTAAPRTFAPPVGGQGNVTIVEVTGEGMAAIAPANSTNFSVENSALPIPAVTEASSVLIYSLGAVGAAVAMTVAAYPFTCWAIDGLLLRKQNWLKSPLIRGQQFYAWCRGKNKTAENSIEMDSIGGNKAEEEDSFLSEGDENASAKKLKSKKQKGCIWTPITRAQKLLMVSRKK